MPPQLIKLGAVVEVLYRLLEANSNQQADGDGGDMDEVFPTMSCAVRRVDIENTSCLDCGTCYFPDRAISSALS